MIQITEFPVVFYSGGEPPNVKQRPPSSSPDIKQKAQSQPWQFGRFFSFLLLIWDVLFCSGSLSLFTSSSILDRPQCAITGN